MQNWKSQGNKEKKSKTCFDLDPMPLLPYGKTKSRDKIVLILFDTEQRKIDCFSPKR